LALNSCPRKRLFLALLFSRKTQRSQALHVLDDSRMASRLLLQCLIDFSFASLIAVEHAFYNATPLSSRHNGLFSQTTTFDNMGMKDNILKHLSLALPNSRRDKVMVTAAPDLIPPPLINQLKAGGRMVIPVGLLGAQQLVVVEKDPNDKVTTKEIMPVLFSLLEGSDESTFRAS
jgi:Protein-L-isoaspartate(D-aspartate) O-methyltransferase (PCMT)